MAIIKEYCMNNKRCSDCIISCGLKPCQWDTSTATIKQALINDK